MATRPRELEVIAILDGVDKCNVKQKGGEQCDEAARQGNGTEPPDKVMTVSLARRRRPDGGDEGRMLVRHLFVCDHVLV